jgi:hypothetical protein
MASAGKAGAHAPRFYGAACDRLVLEESTFRRFCCIFWRILVSVD